MKPDREQCLEMAKEAGGQFLVTGWERFEIMPSELERLIHAAYELGRKDAARECAWIETKPMPPEAERGSNNYANGWAHGRGAMREAIWTRFNLHPTDTEKQV